MASPTSAWNSAIGRASAESASASGVSAGIALELPVREVHALRRRARRDAPDLLIARPRGIDEEEPEVDVLAVRGKAARGVDVVRVVRHLVRVQLAQLRYRHAVLVQQQRDAS